MSANSETIPATAEDFAKFTRVQKLAAFLIMIGHDSAAQILKSLNEHELDAVTAEMAKFTTVSQEIQQEILREFTEVAISAGTALRGGVEYAQAALEKAVGIFKATNVVSRNSNARAPIPAMKQIIELEPRQIFNLLKNEQPQTIALIVSYLEAEKAAPLLKLFRPELRDLVVERLATLAPTPVEIIERIVEVLVQKLGHNQVRALNQTGGLKSAANVLNAIDKNMSKSLLTSLEERNPDLGRAIRQKMFTFDDIVTLEASAIQRILREVDMRDLALSLKNAGEKLKSLLLGAISKRAAETVKEEMELLGSAKMRDIEAAQLRIIDIMRRLEAEGEIELGDSKETTDAVMA